MTTPFWLNDPTILFNKEKVLEVWPTQKMSFESKLNAISRIVMLMTILGFIFTRNWNRFSVITCLGLHENRQG